MVLPCQVRVYAFRTTIQLTHSQSSKVEYKIAGQVRVGTRKRAPAQRVTEETSRSFCVED